MAKRSKSYHTLLTRSQNERWVIAFGDYDRKVVEDERDDMRDGWAGDNLAYKIVTTKTDKQADIDAVVSKLNAVTVSA